MRSTTLNIYTVRNYTLLIFIWEWVTVETEKLKWKQRDVPRSLYSRWHVEVSESRCDVCKLDTWTGCLCEYGNLMINQSLVVVNCTPLHFSPAYKWRVWSVSESQIRLMHAWTVIFAYPCSNYSKLLQAQCRDVCGSLPGQQQQCVIVLALQLEQATLLIGSGKQQTTFNSKWPRPSDAQGHRQPRASVHIRNANPAQ